MTGFRKRHDTGQAFPVGTHGGVSLQQFNAISKADEARQRTAPNSPTPFVTKDIKMPERIDIVTFTEKNAKEYLARLKPYVGKVMVLYGGGGWDSDIVKMSKVEMTPAVYHHYDNDFARYGALDPKAMNVKKDERDPHHFTYSLPNKFVVVPTLHLISGNANSAIFSSYNDGKRVKKSFEPHLGSWKLAAVVRNK